MFPTQNFSNDVRVNLNLKGVPKLLENHFSYHTLIL